MKTELTQDQQFVIIEEDLYRWGDWVRRSSVGGGYGDSSFSRISKAKTKVRARRKLVFKSPTLEVRFENGIPISAHYTDTKMVIPVQEIYATSTPENVWTMKRNDKDDELGMEIDRYMAILRGIRPKAFRAAVCKFWFQWPREMILHDLRCKEGEYKSLIRDAKMHVLTCRARVRASA